MTDDENEDGSLLSKVFPISKVAPLLSSMISVKPRSRQLQSVPEDGTDVASEQAPEDVRESLEGTLFHRKGRSSMSSWKRRYVVLQLNDGGSLSCYRFTSKKHIPTRMLMKMYTRLHRRDSKNLSGKSELSHQKICLYIPAEVPWFARDIENDPSSFVVEIPLDYEYSDAIKEMLCEDDLNDAAEDESFAASFSSPMNYSLVDDQMSVLSVDMTDVANSLESDLTSARQKNKPLRFCFNCPQKGSEKALWLRALSELGRLSSQSTKKRKMFGTIKHMARVSRIRTPTSADFARESLQLENDYRQFMPPDIVSTRYLSSHAEVEGMAHLDHNGKPKEYRVQPNYAYPHRWMTHQEMRDEMVLPSLQVHDLRLSREREREVGNLRVEVLQCLGLPKQEKIGTDAVVYLVCGSHAFATDVVPDCCAPMFLCKMRRAATFPLFEAFARLYVGVFSDNGRKDEFIGRCVIEPFRLRPQCTYDVTLPLRLSTHVYSRRKRGAIRLRFHLEWTSEQKALLSYLPKKIRLPSRKPPTDLVTVECSNPKAFRNVAMTVHGAHLPGRFSTNQLRGAIKEINFTRIFVMRLIRNTLRNTVFWDTPSISMFVFCAWMHSTYQNSFALVPAYLLSFILIHLVRNYAKYGIKHPFLPPTWEELFLALIHGNSTGNSHFIEPLDLRLRQSSLSGVPSPASNSHFDEDIVVNTHRPYGRESFKVLGFLEEDEFLDSITNDDDHMEFPFASGVDYPEFTVKESLATQYQSRKSKERADERSSRDNSASAATNEGRLHDGSSDGNFTGRSDDLRRSRDADEMAFIPDERGLGLSNVAELRNRGSSESGELKASDDMLSGEFVSAGSFDDESDRENSFRENDETIPVRPMPEQNIDVRVQNLDSDNKLTMTEELQEIKEKMHEFTFHLFNDRAFQVKDPNAKVWGKPRTRSEKKKPYDSKLDLSKTLNVGQYSHSNPVIARIGLYIEPIVSASMGFLCAFRAGFNVFTWQDPFLSFWTSLTLMLSIMILFVFPWRLFMFVFGIFSVGPQNWFWRVYRERRKLPLFPKRSPKPTEHKATEQPVFHGHSSGNPSLENKKISAEGTHHVVVPYSRLMYQRFYDWPPEGQYSRVKPDRVEPAPAPRRRTTSGVLRKRSFSPSDDTRRGTPPRRSYGNRRSDTHSSVGSVGRMPPQDWYPSIPTAASSRSHDSLTSSRDVQQAWLQGRQKKYN